MCDIKTSTKVSIKASSGKILFCCFAKHSSFDELLRELNSHYKNGSGAEKWYIPLSDPVDGTSRTLSNQAGYEIWIRYGRTQRLDAYISEVAVRTDDNIRTKSVLLAFSDYVHMRMS
jgi:hypothetical protein